MSAFDLKNMKPGDQVEDIFALSRKEPGKTRNGDPFLTLTLSNSTGEAKVKVWDRQMHMLEGIEPLCAVRFVGKVEEYKGQPQLSLMSIEYRGTDHPVIAGNPSCPIPVDELDARYQALLAQIANPGYRLFLDRFFETGCPWEDFSTAPAALKNHHAYLHGLYEHSLQVAEIALGMIETPLYRGRVNPDLVIAGALVHDSGKTMEYEWKKCPIRASEAGLLGTHMVYGPQQVVRTFEAHRYELEAAGFTERDALLIQHIQMSHHGEIEWGAVMTPRCIEAQAIHHADLASAKTTGMIGALAEGLPAPHAGWVDAGRPHYHVLQTTAVGAGE